MKTILIKQKTFLYKNHSKNNKIPTKHGNPKEAIGVVRPTANATK